MNLINDFNRRVVLVTGGTKGIGRGIAEGFLAEGATVVVCARSQPEAVPCAGGRSAEFLPCDVREAEAVRALVAAVVQRHGRLDVLIHNAGGSPSADAATASPRFHEGVIRLNLTSALHMAQAANAVMQTQGEGGVIVFIGSVSALRPSPGTAAYGAAKAAVLSLASSLAVEWAPRVRVVAVSPGLVRTEQSHLHYGDEAGIAAVGATIPAGRMAEPFDIAQACLFVASPRASYLSGTNLLLHGGGRETGLPGSGAGRSILMAPAPAAPQTNQQRSIALAEHEWMNAIRPLVGKQYGRVYAWDKINAPMIRQWCEVMGVDDAPYTVAGAVVAPAAMLQVWCMEGLTPNNYPPGSTAENPYEALKLFEAQGFPAVVAVNSELSFVRPVREGERLYYTTRLDAISEEKTTALGTGYFVTLVMTYCAQQPQGDDEPVGELLFRVFKFRPASASAPAPAQPKADAKAPTPALVKRPLPGISDDTRFFWDGARAGQLLIQRCKACGTLRHPPGPVCPSCHSFEWDTVQSSGRGTVYSFVVMHYPEVPPFEHPNLIVLVELEEGTRLISQLVGVAPGQVRIGQAVQVEFNTFNDGELVLPQFRPVLDAAGAPA